MKSIEKNIENTIIINKSKFITKLYFINNTLEINKIIDETKKQYKSAAMMANLLVLLEYQY